MKKVWWYKIEQVKQTLNFVLDQLKVKKQCCKFDNHTDPFQAEDRIAIIKFHSFVKVEMTLTITQEGKSKKYFMFQGNPLLYMLTLTALKICKIIFLKITEY